MTLYTIKPLPWYETEYKPTRWEVDTIFAWLFVTEHRWWNSERWSPCDGIEDGKAKAEAYYRSRLLAALEPAGSFTHRDESVSGMIATPGVAVTPTPPDPNGG